MSNLHYGVFRVSHSERPSLHARMTGRSILPLALFTACQGQFLSPPDPAPADPVAPTAVPGQEADPPTLAPVAPQAPAEPLRLIVKPRARLSNLAGGRAS